MPAKKTGTIKKTASKTRVAEAVEVVKEEKERPRLVGSMRDTVLWYGDLISPVDVEWDVSK